jgi:hypothetical protein
MADNSAKEHGNGKGAPHVVTFRHATSEEPGALSALQVEQLDAMLGDSGTRLAALSHLLAPAGMSEREMLNLKASMQLAGMQQVLSIGMAAAGAITLAETDPEGALDILLASYATVRAAQEPLESAQKELKKLIAEVALPLEHNVRGHGFEAQYRPGYTITTYPKAKLLGVAAVSDALQQALDKIAVTRDQPASVAVRKV